MTAHPLERPALLRARLLMARGQSGAAEAVLRQALAQEPNLPKVNLALARLRWPGPDYRQWLGTANCGRGCTWRSAWKKASHWPWRKRPRGWSG